MNIDPTKTIDLERNLLAALLDLTLDTLAGWIRRCTGDTS